MGKIKKIFTLVLSVMLFTSSCLLSPQAAPLHEPAGEKASPTTQKTSHLYIFYD